MGKSKALPRYRRFTIRRVLRSAVWAFPEGFECRPQFNVFIGQHITDATKAALCTVAETLLAHERGRPLGDMTSGMFSFNSAVFDLKNGVLATPGPRNLSASIAPVSNGWYQCSVTFHDASLPGMNGVPSASPTQSAAPSNPWPAHGIQASGDVSLKYAQLRTTPQQPGVYTASTYAKARE